MPSRTPPGTPPPEFQQFDGSLSPDWYCSGTQDDSLGEVIQLRQKVQLLQQKLARTESALSRSREDAEAAARSLQREREEEVASLSSLRGESERLLEEKGKQIQQLNNTIRRLNDVLRNKDAQLSRIVEQNLKAEDMHNKTVCELSELRVALRHSEAGLNKDKLTLQRVEVQRAALEAQNTRLEELVAQYKEELAGKQGVITEHSMRGAAAHRRQLAHQVEAAEALGDIAAVLTRAECILREHEAAVLQAQGLQLTAFPYVARPGQRVSFRVHLGPSAHPPVHTTSHVNCTAPLFGESLEATCIVGPREGDAIVTINASGSQTQAAVHVEGPPLTGSDLMGTTISIHPSPCHVGETTEVLIVTRDSTNSLVSLPPESIVQRLPPPNPTTPRLLTGPPSTGTPGPSGLVDSPRVRAATPPIRPATPRAEGDTWIDLTGTASATVVSITRLSAHTHRVLVAPNCAGVLSVAFLDHPKASPVSCASVEVLPSQPVYERTRIDATQSVVVGDRSTISLQLVDALGFPCPLPHDVSPASVIKTSAGTGSVEWGGEVEEEATDLGEEIVDMGHGRYAFHFVPLAVGQSSITVDIAKGAVRRVLQFEVRPAGGPPEPDSFVVSCEPQGKCIEVGETIRFSLAFSDASGEPAAAPPSAETVEVTHDGCLVMVGEVSPDPNMPSCLAFALQGAAPGVGKVRITGGGESHVDIDVAVVGDLATVGWFHRPRLDLAVRPSLVPPRGQIEVIATPRDGVGNALATLPDHCEPPKLTVLEGSSLRKMHVDIELRPSGSVWTATVEAPSRTGGVLLTVEGDTSPRAAYVEVSISPMALAVDMQKRIQALACRMAALQFMGSQRDQALRDAEAEITELRNACERERKKAEKAAALHKEELSVQRETLTRECEVLQSRVDMLRESLSEQRKEQEHEQARWGSREEALEAERAQRMEDRRSWAEERSRLAKLKDSFEAQVHQLKRSEAELQGRIRQLQSERDAAGDSKRRELQKDYEQQKTLWEREKSTLQKSCAAAKGTAETLQAELEREAKRAGELQGTVEGLEGRLAELEEALRDRERHNEQLRESLARAESLVSSAAEAGEAQAEQRRALDQTTKAAAEAMEECLGLKVKLEAANYALQRAEEASDQKQALLDAALVDKQRLVNEKKELVGTIEELEAKLRVSTRELEYAKELVEQDARRWNVEKAELQLQLAEGAKQLEEHDRKHREEVEQQRMAFEHEKGLWGTERQSLQERVTSAQADMEAAAKRHQGELRSEREAMAKEREAWSQERADMALAATKLREKIDSAARSQSKHVDDERKAVEEERRAWVQERCELRGRIAEYQMKLDEAQRKHNRELQEMMAAAEEEQNEWKGMRADLEADLQQARAQAAEAQAKSKRDATALRSSEQQRMELQKELTRVQQELAELRQEDMELRRRAAYTPTEMESEKKLRERERERLEQQVHELELALQDAHKRHAKRIEGCEVERQQWVEERAQLRLKLSEIERSATELAEEHKSQISEHEKVVAEARREVECDLQQQLARAEAAAHQKMQKVVAEIEERHAAMTAQWEAEVARQAEEHKAELEKTQKLADERERLLESQLEGVRESYRDEIARLEEEVSKAKMEKSASRQRAEAERVEERQRLRGEYQKMVEHHDEEQQRWEAERTELLKQIDELEEARQKDAVEFQRKLQTACQEEVEAKQLEAKEELGSLREVWQRQLAAAADAHDRDRAAFARERDEFREERVQIRAEAERERLALEEALTAAREAQHEAEAAFAQATELSTQSAERIAELEERLNLVRQQHQGDMEAERKVWEAERQQLERAREQTEGLLDEAKQELVALQAQRARWQREAADASDVSEREKHDLQARLRTRIEELQVEVEAGEAVNKRMQKEKDKLAERVEELTKRVAELRERASGNDLPREEGDTHRILVERNQFEQEVASLKRRLADSEAARERQVGELEEDAADARREAKTLRGKLQEIQERMDEQAARHARDLQEQLDVAREEAAAIERERDELADELAEMREAVGRSELQHQQALAGSSALADTARKEAEEEVARLQRLLETAQVQVAEANTLREAAEERATTVLEEAKAHWDKERQQLLDEVAKGRHEANEQRSAQELAREREVWQQHEARLADEAGALRRKVKALENELHEQSQSHAQAMMDKVRQAGALAEEAVREIEKRAEARNEAAIRQLTAYFEARELEAQSRLSMQSGQQQLEKSRATTKERELLDELGAVKAAHQKEVAKLTTTIGTLNETISKLRVTQDTERSLEKKEMWEERAALVRTHEADRLRWEEERAALARRHAAELEELRSTFVVTEKDQLAQQIELSREREACQLKLDEMREEMETRLAAASQKMEKERAAFAAERAEWRTERAKLYASLDEKREGQLVVTEME
eukprot:Sspe_Gene.24820::Locus_9882_Transcript_2_3_Confidence_0.400_Length_7294::g.24820::m.24820